MGTLTDSLPDTDRTRSPQQARALPAPERERNHQSQESARHSRTLERVRSGRPATSVCGEEANPLCGAAPTAAERTKGRREKDQSSSSSSSSSPDSLPSDESASSSPSAVAAASEASATCSSSSPSPKHRRSTALARRRFSSFSGPSDASAPLAWAESTCSSHMIRVSASNSSEDCTGGGGGGGGRTSRAAGALTLVRYARATGKYGLGS